VRIILHIGLHKTATTFLQKYVFPVIDSSNSHLIYNPPVVTEALKSCLKNIGNADIFEESKKTIHEFMQNVSATDKTVLISNEDISQSRRKLNYRDHFNIVKTMFPEAEIVIFLRYQPDWILSTYKESIKMGCYSPLDKSLNFEKGQFKDRSTNIIGNINIWNVDYYELCRNYIEEYGNEHVHILFYEDFCKQPVDTVRHLLGLLHVSEEYDIDYQTRSNRGYSAFSIALLTTLFPTVAKYEIPWRESRGKSPWFVTSLFFYKVYRNIMPTRLINKILKKFVERYFWWDWDLLKKGDMRAILDAKFKADNRKLLEIVSEERIPRVYIE
jgi:hypothetical protein